MVASSLHRGISLSFYLFLYNGVCFDELKLSVYNVIFSQKGSNGDKKLQFFGRDFIFINVCVRYEGTNF